MEKTASENANLQVKHYHFTGGIGNAKAKSNGGFSLAILSCIFDVTVTPLTY